MKISFRLSFLLVFFLVFSIQAQSTKIDSSPADKSKDQPFGERLLKAASKYYGVRYRDNGRSEDGVDCMGLIFLAYRDVTQKDWKNLPTWPRVLVESEKLGRPVDGLAPVLKKDIDYKRLKRGDIVYLLVPFQIGSDQESFAVINKIEFWPWLVGIYAGKGKCLYAKPNDRVRIDRIKDLLDPDDAIFVTRY